MSIHSYHSSVHRIFAALSDPNRMRIVSVLQDGPLNVSEVSAILHLTQSNASRHLRSLLDSGIVKRQGASGWVWYSLDTSDPVVRDACRLASAGASGMPGHEADRRELARCYELRRSSSREFFARLAPEWSRFSSLLPDPSLYSAEIGSLLPRGAAVAELGCGTGTLFPVISGDGRSVIGIDNSPEMLSAARKRAEELGISDSVDLRLGEVEHLPMADESVDCVLAHMVLHHLSRPNEVYSESWRVLRPGAAFLLVELTEHGNPALRKLHGDLWPGFDPAQVSRDLRASGFDCRPPRMVAGGKAFLLFCTRKESR
jgi:ArsR family transcriptional regulator